MKILLLADIHSNWPALQAIDETFDACLFLGDLVDYLSDPAPCIEWVRQHATAAIRGNHDHAVAQRIPVRRIKGLSRLSAETRPMHWNQLSSADLKFLGRLPVTRRIELDGKVFYLVHATPRDPFDEYLKEDPSGWLNRLTESSIEADFVCVGHSHIPFCIEVGSTRVVNPGSVGQPRDGDPRCSYCIIENGDVSFHRVEYDISRTVDHLRQCGVTADTITMTEHFLRTGGRLLPEFS